MYAQFSAVDREVLDKSLRTLNSDTDNKSYQEALISALVVLHTSRADGRRGLNWAIESISAYREIGKSLVNLIQKKDLLDSAEWQGLKQEFKGILEEYSGKTTEERVRAVLSDLEEIGGKTDFSKYDAQTLAGKIKGALADLQNISRVMRQYGINNENELGVMLKEREKLLTQSERFAREFDDDF